eukprot:CAMPEP_0198145876 /NCGR_PEP_ID=MMETSP1443-20131203/25876_1 /TAXON_ID=186043 /ORGANISM="Entomoneis sp., Strain CCMP2396" /LENGTH=297 /DNA_ID=CAMNT_0043809631 /DNA_START=26 /DNA_END=919 /DNA_ORIENTATION=+
MTRSMSNAAGTVSRRLVYGKDDALFGSIERQQGDKPFGTVLDAGTGIHSLRWLATLKTHKDMEKCVAVTADETMQTNCQREVESLGVDDHVDVIIGNWFDAENPLDFGGDDNDDNNDPPQRFDVILADYLIGAMDGFSPYAQDQMIPKLARLLKPGGRLYIVGLQPLPDSVPDDPHASLICKVRQVRDACILLSGHRCYREYPVDWIQSHVSECKSLDLLHTSQFPIMYKQATIVKQINVARAKFPHFPSEELAASMADVLDDLEDRTFKATREMGRIQLGFDYVVTAEKLTSKLEI